MNSNRFAALDPNPYCPLEGKYEIRNLILLPAGNERDAIRCQLRNVSLSTHPSYEAVSYCWEGNDRSSLVWLKDRKHYVTDNLDSFLRFRRHCSQSLTLWIDALCISQSDDKEKERQVLLMGSMYLLSERLTIWLDPPADESNLAIATMLYIAEGDDEKIPYLTSEYSFAVSAFFSRRWWTRIWILQEFILGSIGSKIEITTLKCGNDEIPWSAFETAVQRIHWYQVESRQYFPSVQKIIDMLDLRSLVTGDGNYESQNALLSGQGLKSAPSILDLVISHRNFGASDPRDKIYGLLSLALRNEPAFKSLIPDYTIPAIELFMTFAYSAIIASNSLAILSHCRGQSLEDIPSWIPDWSHNRNGQILGGPVATTEDRSGDRIESDTDRNAIGDTNYPREDDTLTDQLPRR